MAYGNVQCVSCQGRGVHPGTGNLSCIVCKGNGRVAVQQPSSLCKECEGRGKKPSATLYCFSCRGKGCIEKKSYPSTVKLSKLKKKVKRVPHSALRGIEAKEPLEAQQKKSFFKGLLGTFRLLF